MDTDSQGDDERFQLASNAARRIVQRSRENVLRTLTELEELTDNAGPTTPYGAARARAVAGSHRLAFDETVSHVEALSNAVCSHLNGLELLVQHDTSHPLPQTVIARAIAEACASVTWILGPALTPEEKAARGYAALFRSLNDGITNAMAEDRLRLTQVRDRLIADLKNSSVHLEFKEKGRKHLAEVSQVTVGGTARAKTSYNISQRLDAEIPAAGRMYRGLSATAHAERLHLAGAWNSPDMYARRIGVIVHESVSAWSRAIYAWVGVQPPELNNDADLKALRQSIHPRVVESIVASRNRPSHP